MKSVYSANFKSKISTNLHGQPYSAIYKNYTMATAIYTAATSKKKLVANWTEMSFIASYGWILLLRSSTGMVCVLIKKHKPELVYVKTV
jgi:hypothetical protein